MSAISGLGNVGLVFSTTRFAGATASRSNASAANPTASGRPGHEASAAAPTIDPRSKRATDQATPGGSRSSPTTTKGRELSPEQLEEIERLKERDAEVRRHEQAHVSAGGQYVIGGPTFDYQTGPDGRRYAVGGEVQIDTSEVPNNPSATIQKMQQVRRAALAPAEPSAQDRQIAAAAAQKEQEARVELTEEQRANLQRSKSPVQGSETESADATGDSSNVTSALAEEPATRRGSVESAPTRREVLLLTAYRRPVSVGSLLDVVV